METRNYHDERPISIKKAQRRFAPLLKILGICVGGLALLSVFLPFVYFLFGQYQATLSGFQLITKNIRITPDILITIPLLMRISLLLAMVCLGVGMAFLLIKKTMWATLTFFAATLLSLIQLPFVSEITKQAATAGLSPVNGSMLSGWTFFFLFALLSTILSLATLGVEKSAEMVFQLTACISIGIVIIITLYMFISGSPAIVQIGLGNFIFGTQWQPTAAQPSFGILYMILASIFGCLGAIIIGVPIGLMTAVFLAEVAPKWIRKIVQPSVELLAGIPSVIYGFWGMKVLVPFIRDLGAKLGYNTTGAGLLAVILILAIMILPTIISVAGSALKSVPLSYTEASLALGNTKISTIFAIQIPAARSGILAGVILGVGRAIGETMAVIMVAGNMVKLPGLFSSVRPMTAGIAFEMGYAEAGLHREALFAIGLVLFVFIMIVNIAFTFISKRGVQMNAK